GSVLSIATTQSFIASDPGCARPERIGGRRLSAATGCQGPARGHSCARRFSINVLRGAFASLSLSQSCATMKATSASPTTLLRWLYGKPASRSYSPLHRLGVLQGKAGAPHRTHGGPRDQSTLEPHVPDGAKGLGGYPPAHRLPRPLAYPSTCYISIESLCRSRWSPKSLALHRRAAQRPFQKAQCECQASVHSTLTSPRCGREL